MKTLLPKNQIFLILAITLLFAGFTTTAQAQNTNFSKGLKFDGYTKTKGTDLSVGAEYLFTLVNDSTDALVCIDSLVNGATISKLDDNSNGTGYKDAFQPAIKSGNLIGKSYAVFTIKFFRKGTTTPILLSDVRGTALDIDGNVNLKEFAEINVGNGGTMSYMSTTTDISLLNMLLPGSFMGMNILGIERSGIDTTSYNNMFTATNTTGVSSVTMKFGTFTILPSTTVRQFSMFMKGFYYPSSTLPVKMASFTATLNPSKKVDLKWQTSSEINVSHFVIEKSTDGANFIDAGVVFAYGSASTDANYIFSDNLGNVQTGVFYYRIRSVDIDEKSQLSETRMIKISNSPESNLQITTFPNPASNEVRITIPANWQNKKVAYQLFSANGQPVKATERSNSNQTEVINVSNLAPGLYFVKVVCEGQVAQQKIVKH